MKLSFASWRRIYAALFVALDLWCAAAFAPSRAQDVCPPTTATVTDAYRVDAAYLAPPPAPGAKRPPLEMGDTIEVAGTDLDKTAVCGGTGRPLVLVLGGHALANIQPVSIGATALRFELKRDDTSKDAWASILGRPQTHPKRIAVTVGWVGREPLHSDATIDFIALPPGPFGFCFLGLALLLAAFLALAAKTNIIRDGGPEISGAPTGAFSLSQTQAAWWFFFVLAAYLLIGIVTGDFTTSLNGTALTLLAIGGGTAIGSALIGTSRDNSADEKEVKKAAAAKVDETIKTLDANPDTPDQGSKLEAAKQSQAVLRRQTRGFVTDILTDADGVCYHRFQTVAWTLTLTGIFVTAVYKTLAMPDFDATLLGLLGISSLTYLGLKPTEATVPAAVKAKVAP